MTEQHESPSRLLTAFSDDELRAIAADIPAQSAVFLAVKLDGSDRIAAAFGRAIAMEVRRAALVAVAELLGTRARVFIGGAANGGVIFDIRQRDASELIRDTAARLSSTVTVSGVGYFIQNNIGVAFPEDSPSSDPADLLQAAIGAIHASVTTGVHIAYAADVSIADLRAEVALAAELASSDDEAFTLHYQPIVKLDTFEVVGYESLLRWTVDGRLRLPGEFLEAAEETSLIVPIGRWGVTQAIRQLGAWRESLSDTDSFFISVNFSSQQLYDRDLTTLVRECLIAEGVPAGALWVEVTERDLISADSPAAQTIRELHDLGCVICVDDLGTGYAALRYMMDQPITVAKIDRSLVDGMEREGVKRRIVEAVCHLSATLDISTVAEGVEHDDQVDLLREIGFTHGQGFLFGKPAPASEITR
ncbi:EAL domain-containing protein [Williamsia maris]|uniref:EAL domain, c-di-GMP-specific phosphodiesterase class I (Or its enzymatically inactive variant) n=1 Tax=Williamsia maris TaxID=72806 RepID=A0ABT1HE42_9NOCA|nr:EAL domain-containing protein [Williamsia maris]MCP2176526.1 EAL domain, c-di-GMP-specific phosphodiesterase class I (or its enzymatically inactive variant) [Williamsia maris]